MKVPSEIIQQLCSQFKKHTPKTLPAYKKLYELFRQQILDGSLLPGMCLPSSRILAASLRIARNTVLAAINQLCSEGYAETKEKSGVYILATLPVTWNKCDAIKSSLQLGLSKRGKLLLAQAQTQIPRSGFAVGVPDLNEFPFTLWQRYLARYAKNPKLEWLTNSQQGGNLELRKILTDYLRLVRGIRCQSKQIIITYGTQHSLQLIADSLADPGDRVWMENPGYLGARSAFTAAALSIIDQPIDTEGMSPISANLRCLICVLFL